MTKQKSLFEQVLEDPSIVNHKIMDSLTEDEQYEIVKKETFTITYISNPSEKIANLAIEEKPFLIKYIKVPYVETIKLAIKKDMRTFYILDNNLINYQIISFFLSEYKKNTKKII